MPQSGKMRKPARRNQVQRLARRIHNVEGFFMGCGGMMQSLSPERQGPVDVILRGGVAPLPAGLQFIQLRQPGRRKGNGIGEF